MIHKIAHFLGLYTGTVYTWLDPDTNKLMIGFKCSKCGDITDIHESTSCTVNTSGCLTNVSPEIR